MGFSIYQPFNRPLDPNIRGFGGIGSDPQRFDITPEQANILACPWSTVDDYTDLTGNHTFDPKGTVFGATAGYNGEPQLFLDRGGDQSLRSAPGQNAHAIGGTSPVTFGFFFRPSFYNGGHFMCSSRDDGSGNCNYGLTRTGSGTGTWFFRNGTGTTNLGVISPADSLSLRWYHVAFRCNAGTNTGDFFWNGKKIWSGATGTRKTAEASDRINLNEFVSTTNNPQTEAHYGNSFISNLALSDSQIKLLSDQAFGHGSAFTDA